VSTYEVLLHLNIEVEADDHEGAREAARAYLFRHNIPVDDIALIDVQ